MDCLPTAHFFKDPWSDTIMPVNDLSWPMWEVWSCFYPATLEVALDADHIIQQDKDSKLIEMTHSEGKHIAGGLSACVTEETLNRSAYDRERLLKTCCLDLLYVFLPSRSAHIYPFFSPTLYLEGLLHHPTVA
jgi:hypothetical protein